MKSWNEAFKKILFLQTCFTFVLISCLALFQHWAHPQNAFRVVWCMPNVFITNMKKIQEAVLRKYCFLNLNVTFQKLNWSSEIWQDQAANSNELIPRGKYATYLRPALSTQMMICGFIANYILFHFTHLGVNILAL